MSIFYNFYPEIISCNINSYDELKKELNKFSEQELKLIDKAYFKAEELHRNNEPRKTGEPYITHPLSVASILVNFGADCNTVCAGLLHDTVEDTNYTLLKISEDFNDEIAQIVDVVTKINNSNLTKREASDATIRKILEGIVNYGFNGINGVMVKFADRIHNIQTIGIFREEKQNRIAKETMDIYVPLARRYGIYEVKDFLSDFSFYYLDRDNFYKYYELRDSLEKNYEEVCKELYLLIKEKLSEENINSKYIYKVKNLYGLYKDSKGTENFDRIKDLIGLKIVLEKPEDCYIALGKVHFFAKPLGRNIVDYIALPKPNGYRSLNSYVRYKDANIQTRIRTDLMEKDNRLGITSKDNPFVRNVVESMKTELQALSGLNNKEFVSKVENSILKPNIEINAPTGRIEVMHEGDTALDYAKKVGLIDEDIDKIYINGEKKDLGTLLSNGDSIFVLTKKRK